MRLLKSTDILGVVVGTGACGTPANTSPRKDAVGGTFPGSLQGGGL
jgi:hypothetical protein